MRLNVARIGHPLSIVAVLLLAACTSTGRAPVEDRNAATRTQSPPAVEAVPQVAKPGYYIVKRGDTLISIALEQGQDWRDIANWNGIDNPNLILVGQELKVRQGDGSSTKPVVSPVIEAKPLEPKATGVIAPTANEDVATRREPKGGKVAYSEQALSAAMKADEASRNAPRAASPAVAVVPDSKLAEAPAKESSPESKTVATEPKGNDDFEWVWPAAGKVVTAFNDSTNKGVDIGGQLGDPVLAAAPGKVVYVGSGLRGYGNLVIIKHNATYLSAYAHNQKILVKEGQSVKKGQEIAALGDSDADRAKLHFEIRRQGKPVDPVKYLPKR